MDIEEHHYLYYNKNVGNQKSCAWQKNIKECRMHNMVVKKLFIDDERHPSDENYEIVRSSAEAIAWTILNGIPERISFDHDLGGEDTSRVFINWLTDQLIEGRLSFPENFKFSVHSQNPIGAQWIFGTMNQLISHFKATHVTRQSPKV